MSKNLFTALDSDDDETPVETRNPVGTRSYSNPFADNWRLWHDVDEAPPCRCCSAVIALEDDSRWFCSNQGRRWVLLDEPFNVRLPHSADICSGERCRFHPLLSPELATVFRATAAGQTWGDLMMEEEALARSLETAEQRAARLLREAVEAERRATEAERYRREREADLVACRAKMGLKRGEAVRKQPIPCKKLYSCQGDKSSGGAKPTTMHVSSECWAHEYTDPTTGRRVVKHVCPWIHPGEEGWLPQWNSNRLFKPAGAAPANRFAATAAEARPRQNGGAGAGHRHGPQCAGGCGGGRR